MQKQYIQNIGERDQVDTLFMVREKVTAMAKNGKPYLNLKLADRTGEMDGRLWDRVDEFSALFQKGDILRFTGKATLYIGKMQLVIQSIEKVDEANIDLADFLPVSSYDRATMEGELRQIVAALNDPWLRRLMESFLADTPFLNAFATAPAAKTMHHVYIGGLLEHSLCVARLAGDICGRYLDLNRDLVIVGALLHDIGKIHELSFDRTFEYTDAGKLLGHIMIGVDMIEEKLRQIEGFPEMLRMMIKHLILSHHGQYEYGSPKRPKTLEAVVLNYADDLDSKINGIRSHIEKEQSNEEDWTSYHRFYERYFYKRPVGEQQAPVPSHTSAATAPSSVSHAPQPASPAVPAQKPAREKSKERHSGNFTLGEQLKGKNLDLFSTPTKEG